MNRPGKVRDREADARFWLDQLLGGPWGRMLA